MKKIKFKFCTLMLLIIALCLCAVPVAAANDNQLTEEQETQIKEDYAAWMNGLYPDEEEPWEPEDVGQLKYYGDYNEYMVLEFNDWHGGDTLCVVVERHIAGYVFELANPITVLCVYKDGEFIDLEVAYEDGLLTQWQIREINLNYFYVRPESQGEWTNDNSIYASIKPKYVDEVLQNVSGAFADLLDLKATYVTEKYFGDDLDYYLSLRLVLSKSGQAEMDSAIAKLNADKRVEYARIYDDVPFETINTQSLVASSNTVEVGDTITVRPEGELKIYFQPFMFDYIVVELAEYDSGKEYTPDDFPQFDIASIEKRGCSWACYLCLTLEEPGYFNVCKAVNAFATDPAIQSVWPNACDGDEDEYLNSLWKISDTSIAYISDMGLHLEYEEVTIKGLKPGKITLTYVRAFNDHYYMADDYPVTCEITVTEAVAPPTGGSSPAGWAALGILAVALLSVSILSKKKSFA